MMALAQNFPFFSIVLAMFAGIISSVLPGKAAKWLNTLVITAVGAMSGWLLVFLCRTGEPFVYWMGHFPAPWGNELRAGLLEAGMALVFAVIMLFSLVGGRPRLELEVAQEKQNLYYILTNLLLSSLLVMVYTNDLFTAYVFVEINTIAACGLIMIREIGRTIEAAVRYMIMSLLGSGLFLIGICILYDLTGHLLMSNIKQSLALIVADGTYTAPLLTTIGLMSAGLAIKSALFPFHSWLPAAYGSSTVSSSAMLSSLVSKGYLFLQIKIFYRVIGLDVITNSQVIHILFLFGLMGMIFGSLSAIRENDIRRMISFSSVAQIGYIYMGFGLGTELGMIASVYHIISHAATKSLLFLSAVGITDASGGSKRFLDLTGAGYRNKIAGVAFSVGCLSMVGIPMFAGFVSKLLFAQAAVGHTYKTLPALLVLAVSTILNAIYFMKTVIRIYTPQREEVQYAVPPQHFGTRKVTLLALVVLNVAMGMLSQPIVSWIQAGLAMFG